MLVAGCTGERAQECLPLMLGHEQLKEKEFSVSGQPGRYSQTLCRQEGSVGEQGSLVSRIRKTLFGLKIRLSS